MVNSRLYVHLDSILQMILMKAAAKRDLVELCRCSKRKAYLKVDMLFAENFASANFQ